MSISLAAKLRYLIPDLDFLHECILRDDGNGPYIAEWNRQESQPTQNEINGVTLQVAKAIKLAEVRNTAKIRIYTVYPDWRQQNAALGLLPVDYVLAMHQYIASVIQASNTAEDQIDAATTEEQVNGVIPLWP